MAFDEDIEYCENCGAILITSVCDVCDTAIEEDDEEE